VFPTEFYIYTKRFTRLILTILTLKKQQQFIKREAAICSRIGLLWSLCFQFTKKNLLKTVICLWIGLPSSCCLLLIH